MKTEIGQITFKKNGTVGSKRVGLNYFASYNFFQNLINMSWGYFLLIVVMYFFMLSLIFGLSFYYVLQHTFSGIETNYSLLIKQFFFSVQTLTSGQSPSDNNYINMVSSILSLIGILTLALITGLIYARFAKPTANILYSKNIVVDIQKNNIKTYSIRVVNAKISQLIDAECQLIISLNETINNKQERRMYYVSLLNSTIAFLNSSWIISHLSDQNSPIYNLDIEDLIKKDVEFIFSIKALDDTYVTQVHTRISYKPSDIVFNTNFRPISYNKKGIIHTAINKVSELEIKNT